MDIRSCYKELNLPHPWFPHCDILVPWVALEDSHPNTSQFTKEKYQKRQRLAEENIQISAERSFQTYY